MRCWCRRAFAILQSEKRYKARPEHLLDEARVHAIPWRPVRPPHVVARVASGVIG